MYPAVNPVKDPLRKEAIKKRRCIPESERKTLTEEVMKRLLSLEEVRRAKRLSCYVSFRSEVGTHELVKELLRQGKEVSVPIIHGGRLILSSIGSFDDLDDASDDGILEPSVIRKVEVDDLDLVIVPGVAFDRMGDRMGFGKGYYDKLLFRYPGKKIALAFSEQLMAYVPTEPHDIIMDIVVTDKEIIRLNS
ncbi:TPA: 5-formyltetrahydrofolate cyclo-ligase [Candidatus Woesearchaeota archaeon]|nr:5-formyltetrahydrofolate cyclo-ligase [Candidatus Woesearchaeota archaeon]HII68331.1 5-formyltetrahydrofolate cyclo-ligase [Candidatus Woesearchaeota archaeon]